MLLLVLSVKLVAEVALLALLGQGALGLLAGAARERNVFYRVLQAITRPFINVARWVTPRVVIDRHVPWVAVLLLMFVWLAALVAKVRICLSIGMALCR